MGITFGMAPDYRSLKPCAWGQAQSKYLALPGSDSADVVTYRIEGTVGTTSNPTYDTSTGLFAWTPAETDIGTYPIKFWAKVGEDSISKPDTVKVERGYDALTFNGDYTSFGNTNLANATRDSLTAAVWLRIDTTSTDTSVFFGKGRRADSNLEWQIAWRKSTPCSLRVILSGDGFTQSFASVRWNTNQVWQHVAFSYAAGTCSVYVNGALAASDVDATSPAWPAALFAGSGIVCVGAADGSGSTTYQGSNCWIAMPTAYGRSLTAEQISAFYEGTYAGSETMKATRTNGTTTAGTIWYDDGTAPDGVHGTSGALPGFRGHYAVWPIAGQSGP
jgi:hypothetical protein